MEGKCLDYKSGQTERLYDADSYRKEFTAVVKECLADQKGYQVVLDCTAFFPEGGGQFGDTGWLEVIDEETASDESCGNSHNADAVRVADTQEKDGVIYHRTDRMLTAGTKVRGWLDFEKRFDRMQQHSGEHIVSGIVHGRYGYHNVGFHLGDDVTTLDFDGELTAEQVDAVELLANQAVFANLPVEILYPSRSELASLSYRSKIEIEGQVRLVRIPGVDLCACCAPHVGRTGEIGLVKVLSYEHHRGGCRMTIACGARALADYRKKQSSVTEVSVFLSAKPERIAEAVAHLKEQQMHLREQFNRFQKVYLDEKLAMIRPEDRVVCIFEEEMDTIAIRNFVNDAMVRCSGVCGAFVGTDEAGYRYIIGSRAADTREIAKKLNKSFDGRGGGKPEMVQGSLQGTEAAIDAAFRELVR